MVGSFSPQQVHEMLQSEDKDFLIIDVLSDESFANQHVPRAINIPFPMLKGVIEKVATKDRMVIVYCYSESCTTSGKAARLLEELGYTNVYDMDVGIQGYKEAGFPVASEYE